MKVNNARAKEMYDCFTSGETMQSIANRYGVSRQYVSQLFKSHGFQPSSNSINTHVPRKNIYVLDILIDLLVEDAQP